MTDPVVHAGDGGRVSRKAIEEANRRAIQASCSTCADRSAERSPTAAPAASLFTGKGLVAKVVTRKVTLTPLEATGERLWKGRTVVLIDDATGGAAEVFAAALHDRAEATTVGETTVGMAIVQRQVPTSRAARSS